MKIAIEGVPSFGYVHVDLAPGEKFIAESGAMASMDADLDMHARLNGGFIGGLMRKFLGGESLFINEFVNNTDKMQRLTLSQPYPGDIRMHELKDTDVLYMQPGAYICSEPGVKVSMKWAGLNSWIGGEGLFRLHASGNGRMIFGAYGGLIEREIDGELIVDTDHLVAYPEGIKIKTQLSGGIISSLTSGEGFVMRVKGKGKIIIQSRSFRGLSGWVNRNL